MKKHFFSIVSILLLAILTSCTALSESYSSVSVTFPEGTARQLTSMRAADNTNGKYSLTLKTTGDYETTKTETFAKLEEIDNKSFTLDGIQVGKTLQAKVQIAYDGYVYYEGTSGTITVAKGDNNVDLKLKAVTGTVKVGLEVEEFNFELYEAVGLNKTGLNSITYRPDTNSFKYIAPFIGNDIYMNNSATYEWRIDGEKITSRSSSDSNYFLLYDYVLAIKESALESLSTINIECTIIDGTNWKTVTKSFNIVFPEITISTNISTQYVLWNYIKEGSKYNYNIGNITGVNFKLRKNSGIYYKKQYMNGDVFVYDTSNPSEDPISITNAYLFYSDLENDCFSCLDNYSGTSDKTIRVYDSQYNELSSFSMEIPSDIPYQRINHLATSTYSITKYYAYDYTQNETTYVHIQRSINGTNIKLSELYNTYKVSVKDMIILNNYLLLLAGSENNLKSVYQPEEYPNGIYMNGALIVIDMDNPKNFRLCGAKSNSFASNSYEIKHWDSLGDEKITKVLGSNSVDSTYFFDPQRIIGIKDDELYIADSGVVYKDAKSQDTENDNNKPGETKINRIMKVNLKDFTVSVNEDLTGFTLADYGYISSAF